VKAMDSYQEKMLSRDKKTKREKKEDEFMGLRKYWLLHMTPSLSLSLSLSLCLSLSLSVSLFLSQFSGIGNDSEKEK
jgi:hypothetical protein